MYMQRFSTLLLLFLFVLSMIMVNSCDTIEPETSTEVEKINVIDHAPSIMVGTQQFENDGTLTGVTASKLNFGGGYFTLVEGSVSPNVVTTGNYDNITNIAVIHFIRNSQGQIVASYSDNPASIWVSGNVLHFSSQSSSGWLVYGDGYTFGATIQIWWTRALNPLQTGTKAFEGTFPGINLGGNQIPAITASASINTMPTKPIHSVNLSGSYQANGATILQRKLWLRVDGGSWQAVSVSGINPFTASIGRSDTQTPITYEVMAEVQYNGRLFGEPYTGWVSDTYSITYYGEIEY